MAAPTLRRQVQVGFLEEAEYGVQNTDAEGSVVRPVVREFSIVPTQERQNVGRTGSIDASRSFFSTQTYEFTATVEADPNFGMWFLKWGLGKGFDVPSISNLTRFVPLPLDEEVSSFSIYLDTQQNDFINTGDNSRTLLFTGGVVQSLTFRSQGKEADKSIIMEVSGPCQQPNVSDEYPYPMIGAGMTLSATHPVIGVDGNDIIPYIHQNFSVNAISPDGVNLEMLDASFTINNTLKMNTYPDGDNEPFFSEIIYQGRQLQIEWTGEYRNMLEYQLFHEAKNIEGFAWNATHLLEYVADSPYKLNFFFPKVAISGASQIMEAGHTEDTLENVYTADLINRADVTESALVSPDNQVLVFTGTTTRLAHMFTARTVGSAIGAGTAADPKDGSYLSFVELPLVTGTAALVDADLTMYIMGHSTDEPTDMAVAANILATSTVVKTAWVSNSPVTFRFDSPAKLVEGDTYWMVLQSSVALATDIINVLGDSGTDTGATSQDSGSAWVLNDAEWDYTLGWDGFPVLIEVLSDGDYTP